LDFDSITPTLHGCVIELGAANLALARRLIGKYDIERYDYVEPVCWHAQVPARVSRVAESVEQWRPQVGGYDFAIALDVIEHLFDPYDALEKVWRSLKSNGQLILSVPNIGHYSVIRRLACGEFEYQDAGLLDRTHVRFYTPKSVDRLLSSRGFARERVVFKTRTGRVARVLPSLRCYQYLCVWRKSER
jgi:SAM-dependent methyltransferase